MGCGVGGGHDRVQRKAGPSLFLNGPLLQRSKSCMRLLLDRSAKAPSSCGQTWTAVQRLRGFLGTALPFQSSR
jgi:hypothetical protein